MAQWLVSQLSVLGIIGAISGGFQNKKSIYCTCGGIPFGDNNFRTHIRKIHTQNRFQILDEELMLQKQLLAIIPKLNSREMFLTVTTCNNVKPHLRHDCQRMWKIKDSKSGKSAADVLYRIQANALL